MMRDTRHPRVDLAVFVLAGGLAGGAPVLIGVLYPQSWSTVAAAAHLTALAVGFLIPGFWLAELLRRRSSDAV